MTRDPFTHLKLKTRRPSRRLKISSPRIFIRRGRISSQPFYQPLRGRCFPWRRCFISDSFRATASLTCQLTPIGATDGRHPRLPPPQCSASCFYALKESVETQLIDRHSILSRSVPEIRGRITRRHKHSVEGVGGRSTEKKVMGVGRRAWKC